MGRAGGQLSQTAARLPAGAPRIGARRPAASTARRLSTLGAAALLAAVGPAIARADTPRPAPAAARDSPGGAQAPGFGVLQLPAPSADEAPADTAPARAPGAVTTRLTNALTLAAWAHPARVAPIYLHPNPASRRLGRTHLQTEDGFAEVYELLRRRVEPHGRDWVEIRIPGRPNGRRGWIATSSLAGVHRTRWHIVISLRARRLMAYFDGRVQLSAPVGVGKPASPTPRGRFWIRERFRVDDRSNPYWPYALGTSDYSTLTDWPGGGVVGIHGDFGAPELIPGAPSHGCVRMRDADIARLAPRISLGTPVDIV